MNIPRVFVRNHGVINLGRQGENDVLQIIWKGIVPAWAEKYGEGKFQLAVRRHLDDAPYIAAIEIDGNDIVWTATSAETAQTGDGECELTYMVGDAVAKSQTWTTSVCRSLTGEEPTEAPEPYQSWVDEVMKTANDLKLQGIPEGGEKGQALIKKSDESFDAEWAKIEALPEGGVEGQVLTKKSDTDGDAEWQNAAQSDWLEIDESSPSYIKNKLGGYYEADFESKAFDPVYLLAPPNNLITLDFDSVPQDDDVYYLSIKYDESVAFDGELEQTCFVTFKTLEDKNNNLSFYISRDTNKQYDVHEKNGKIKNINGYSTTAVPWDSSFIPVANNANYGAVKVSENISPDDINFQAIGIDKNGYLQSRKGTKVIASLTSDNLSDLFVSVGTLFTVSSSTYLEEKLGLYSLDFPVFIANTEIEYGYTYPHFIFLLFTKTNKSGEFILTPSGELINYAITTSTSLGISGATTGKIAKIKTVDTEGKPTEWEQADLPESNLFLVHLIQGEPDSDGDPTYTVDKTFAEIKTAYDAGKKVELIPPADDQNFIVSVGSVPFEVVNVTTKAIYFQSLGGSPIGIPDLPPWMLGGMPLRIIVVCISPDEKVSVTFPFSVDADTGSLVWDRVQKLPQQYVVTVTAGTDGTLSANSTLAQLQSVIQAYGMDTDIFGAASINADYNEKLYYMSAGTSTSLIFTATTENGLETLTVSNDGKEGSADVWTHEVVPLGISPVSVTTADNGKFLRVVDGQWAADSIANAKGVNF